MLRGRDERGAAAAADALATAPGGPSTADRTFSHSTTVAAAAAGASRDMDFAAAEEITANFSEFERQATDTSAISRFVVHVPISTPTTVATCGEASWQVSRVVNLLAHISRQTRLLALDDAIEAAIEAARSGEVGRGFSLVTAEE